MPPLSPDPNTALAAKDIMWANGKLVLKVGGAGVSVQILGIQDKGTEKLFFHHCPTPTHCITVPTPRFSQLP